MKKLPEVSNRKRDDACVKEKRLSSGQREQSILPLSDSIRRTNNTILLSGILGTTHASLDVASVSPFTQQQSSLYWSALCWNIQDPRMNCRLTLTELWRNFQKKTNPYGSPKYQMLTHTYMKRINVFLTLLTGGFNHFNVFRKNFLIHGMVVEPSK